MKLPRGKRDGSGRVPMGGTQETVRFLMEGDSISGNVCDRTQLMPDRGIFLSRHIIRSCLLTWPMRDREPMFPKNFRPGAPRAIV